MIRTLDDIMFIVDGNNPYRTNLIYGTGGLGYKPYRGMYGGTIMSDKDDEEELIKKIENLDTKPSAEEEPTEEEPTEEEPTKEEPTEEMENLDTKPSADEDIKPSAFSSADGDDIDKILDRNFSRVKNNIHIPNDEMKPINDYLKLLTEQNKDLNSSLIDIYKKVIHLNGMYKEAPEALKGKLEEKKNNFIKEQHDKQLKIFENEKLIGNIKKMVKKSYTIECQNVLDDMSKQNKVYYDKGVITKKEYIDYKKKILDIKPDDINFGVRYRSLAKDMQTKINKHMDKIIKNTGIDVKNEETSELVLKHIREEIKQNNSREEQFEKERAFEEEEKRNLKMTKKQKKKMEEEERRKKREEDAKIEEENARIEEENAKAEKINKLANKKLRQAFNVLKERPKEEYYSTKEGGEYLRDLVVQEYQKRLNEGKSGEDLKRGKIYEYVLAKELEKSEPFVKLSSDIGYYKGIPYEGSTLAEWLPYDIITNDAVIENKYMAGVAGVSYQDIKDTNGSIPLQISKFGGYEKTNTQTFTPYFKSIDGEYKLYGVRDNANNRWIENIGGQNLYTSYLLKDGTFNLKMNNPINFPMKQSLNEGQHGETLYVYDTRAIKQIYGYNPIDKTINIPYTLLNKQRVRKGGNIFGDIKRLESKKNKTKNDKEELSRLFKIKYGILKRMKGGTVEEKNPEKIKEYMESGDIDKMEKVLRAHERARENILSEDYDEEEKKIDLPHIDKVIGSIKRKIDRKKEYNENYFESDDFKEQLEWYKNNLDNLTEDELEEYTQALIAQHEYLDVNNLEKKLFKNEKEIEDYIKSIASKHKYLNEDELEILIEKEKELFKNEKKLFKAQQQFEYLKEKEKSENLFEEGDEDLESDYLTPDDIKDMIIDLKIDEGYGKRFEKVIEKIQDRVKKALTRDKSLIKNNENIQRYKNKMTYLPDIKDSNGKVIKWKKVPLSELLVYDLSQDKNDIELKYYNVGTYVPSEEEIKKDGLILQRSKFLNSSFIPLYFNDENGDVKLYNIWSVKTNDWVNDKTNKDVYVLYQTPSGNYSYHLNNDKDLSKVDFTDFKGDKGEKLFILKPSYKSLIDDTGTEIYKIPYNKLKKIYL